MKNRTFRGASPLLGRASKPVQIVPPRDRPGPAVGHRQEAPRHLIAGLAQLLHAFDYATDVGRNVWEFAIEISDLRNAGMSTSDFRWLVSKGFVQHGQETSLYGAPHRCFQRGKGLTFLSTSAFVLTSQGAAELRELLAVATSADLLHAAAHAAASIHRPVVDPRHRPVAKNIAACLLDGEGAAAARSHPPSPLRLPSCGFPLPQNLKPAWEARRRELRVGELLVKKFRVPAGNQELVLSAFEEEGWPAFIDDPLPVRSEIMPKQRLHNVINRLNGSQFSPILRFHGNGNGEGIGWQLLAANSCL